MKKISRRLFMGGSLAASAGLVFSGCGNLDSSHKASGLTAEQKRGMRFGLVTYMWGAEWNLETLITNCEKAKIYGVELRTQHKHGVDPDINDLRRREVKKRFADSPVALVGLGCNACYDSPDPEKLKQNIEQTKAFLKLSYDVGGKGVKVKPNDFQEGVPHEVTLEQIGKSLENLGPVAAEYNQQLRLEVHGSCCHLLDIKKIMDYVSHPSVKVCWNSNKADLDGEGLEYNFNLVKDRFGDTAHVRELNLEDYPYQELINLFVKTNYAGWILLEARTKPADLVAAMKEQKSVFDHMLAKAMEQV
jgi:sugar phosphate isomerase/epimerase